MPSLSDFLAAELGTRQWVLAPRLTAGLRQRGYDLALSPKRYAALEIEWQRRTCGAPLASLHGAAPALLAAGEAVIANWESGDLAAAVRQLAEAIAAAKA